MDSEELLIERIVDELVAGTRPPVTAADVEHYATQLPDVGDLTIGEAAALFGLTPSTVRYYEDAGLLRIPRRGNGHRVFDRAALGDLLFVHRMRLSGMPIDKIARLQVLLADDAPSAREEASDLMHAHAEQIRRQIAQLQISLVLTEHKTHELIGENR